MKIGFSVCYAVLTLSAMIMSGCVSFNPVRAREEQSASFMSALCYAETNLLSCPLSLDDCVALAMTNNYKARLADLDVALGKISRDVSFSAFLPQVSTSVGYNIYNKDPIMYSKDYASGSIDVGLPLFMPSTWYLYDVMRHSQASAGIVAMYVRQGIRLEVTSRYYDVLVKESMIKAYEAQLAAAKEQSDRADGFVREGMARSWEAQQARTYAQKSAAELRKAQRDLATAKGELLLALGLSPLADINLREDADTSLTDSERELVESGVENLVLCALQTHPQLSLADRNVVIHENKVREAFCAFLPSVSLYASQSFTGNKVNNPPSSNLSYGFRGAWDLFKGFSTIGAYKGAKVEHRRSELEREQTFLSVMLGVVSADSTVRDAAESRAVAESALDAALVKQKDLSTRAGEGLVALSEALDAFAELQEARVVHLRTRYAERIAIANLRYAMGIFED